MKTNDRRIPDANGTSDSNGVWSPEMDDPRIVALLEEYMSALESGRKPDRKEYVKQFSNIADTLAECLDGLEALHSSTHQRSLGNNTPGLAEAEVERELGTRLGDFEIIREVGRGGMGVVYEAEQISLSRRIALKILPFALTLDQRQLERFKSEARTAAQLHHTNIVPVYSVGCEQGVHFYAMQYIDGRTLEDVIDERRSEEDKETRTQAHKEKASSGSPPSLQAFQAVARLGIQTAEALEYAHQRGVIHRDIKPSNLLVDVQERLWITDFGLAQFQSDAALTMTGNVVGTLRYMSPEQSLAKRHLVDHRTDIYSLGATLYELLTLQPAFGGDDREVLFHRIAFEDPSPPRGLNPTISVDLETIVLKAMAKRVEDRYATAQELADDLKRFLEHRPIFARRPTLVERAAKWTRRHKAIVAVVVAASVLAAVGFATSTVLIAWEQWKTQAAYEQLAAEQARTKAAYDAEALQRQRAENSFREARQAVDFFAAVEQELADKPGLQGLRRKMLESALDYYQDFIDERSDDPSIQAELLASHVRVANILNEIGSKEDAEAELAKVKQLEKKLLSENRFVPPYGPGRGWGSPPGVTKGEPKGENSNFWLLSQRPVQEELKLSKAETEKIQQLSRKRRDLMWEAAKLNKEEGHKRLTALDNQEKLLMAELQPAQRERLKQVAMQRRGVRALRDGDVAESLALTKNQLDQISTIQSWKWQTEQLLSVLTAEQKAKWNEMTGEPFTGDIRPGFGGRFGSPGHSYGRYGFSAKSGQDRNLDP